MTADPIQAAKERLERLRQVLCSAAFVRDAARAVYGTEAHAETQIPFDIRDVLAELSRLEGENERLQDPMYCPICNSCGSEGCGCEHACKYAMAHPEVVARVDELEADLADARRQIAERDEALKIQDEALQKIVNARAGFVDNLDDYDDFACGLRETAREARRRAAALLAPGEGKGEVPVKRGDVRVRGDKLCRFIEHDDRGEVWEIIGPAPVHEQGEG